MSEIYGLDPAKERNYKSPKCLAGVGVLLLGWFFSGCSQSQTPTQYVPRAQGVETPSQTLGGRWLETTSTAAEQAGAGHLRVVKFGSGAPGDVVDAFVVVPRTRCALVYARGSENIEDLDLHAFGDDGTELGSDEAPDDEPTLLFCPDEDTRIYVTARVAQGHGLVAIGLHDLSPEKAMAVARATGARNHKAGPQEVDEPWPGLASTLERHREELGGHWVDQRRVALPVDSRVATRITVTVPANRCLDALALASDEVARLELQAEDQNGRIFARGRAKGPNRSLLFCVGDQAQDLKLLVRPHAGRGLAVLAISITRDAQDRLDLNPSLPVEYLASDQNSKAIPALPAPRTTTEMLVKVGELTTWSIKMDGCSRIDLKPDAALLGYAARIWSERGVLLSAARGEWEGPMFVCGSGKNRFEVEASRTTGTLQVEVRETPRVPAPLVSFPLAASRLLSRMQEVGAIRFADDVLSVEQAALQESKLSTHEFSIPSGQCLDVFVAKDQGGFGVEARMLDTDSGLDIGFERGGTSLQISSCATGARPVAGSLQIRTIRGAAPALFSLQLSSLKNATSEATP